VCSIKIYIRETLPERIFELRLILRSRLFNLSQVWQGVILGKKSWRGKRNVGVIIGPANSANQASAWARSLNSYFNNSHSASLRISANPAQEWFHADVEITTAMRADFNCRLSLIMENFLPKDIVLIESLRPIFGFRKGRLGFAPRHSIDDAILLKRMGKKVGMVFHGSDIRDPMDHALRNPHSPFRASTSEHDHSDWESGSILRQEAQELYQSTLVNRQLISTLRSQRIPLFVTTPDLLLEVPDAHWLPSVIDLQKFREVADSSPIFASEKLRVLYIPSRSWIKSSDLILPVLEKLSNEGLIEYENWVENGPVTHDQIPKLLSQSDVVIDQFIGLFGVFALEAVAAGRIVMTYVDETFAHHPTPPHINITSETLEAQIRHLARARERVLVRSQIQNFLDKEHVLVNAELPAGEAITVGANFVEQYHDGRYSSELLATVFRERKAS